MSLWNKLREEAAPPTFGGDAPGAFTPTPPREESKPMAMLKRDELSPVPQASGDLNALLGRGSEFEGKLTFEGTVRIDGKFTGTIVTNDVLVIGEGAKVSAEITCGTVIVHGEINGNVKAKTAVELHHPARMRGNVETPSLMIEKGVIFEGQSKMEGIEKGSSKAPAPSPVAAVKP
jgi:cytoskeletal protein CcmA (bactofilin family)